MRQATEALGPSATISDFEEIDLTPDFEYYADDEDGFEGTADETLPPKTIFIIGIVFKIGS